MITTLLFDLDGTLLDLNMDRFLPKYIGAISKKVAHIVNPGRFGEKLLEATQVMVSNDDSSKTNQEVFVEEFFTGLNICPSTLMPMLEEFYVKDFPKLKKYSNSLTEAREIVKQSFRKGMDVVIATNPVFPRTAIMERLKWANIADFNYSLITSYEDMHYCKPYLGYYKEIIELIGKEPQECMMLGNDPADDMVASEIDIKTFLIEDPHIDQENGRYKVDYSGNLKDMLSFIKQL